MDSEKIYFRHNSFRKEQDKIIVDILSALSKKQSILLNAPTGTGKTDSSLSAAISFARKNNKKILFLTPKISQHKMALEVIDGINQKYNINLKAVDFVGKRNMCIEPSISQTTTGFYEVCKNAVKNKQCRFYNNIKPFKKSEKELVNYAINKLFEDKSVIYHTEMKELAMNFKSASNKPAPVCAYELAKQYARECDIIIADYYHLFSKTISDNLLPEIGIDLEETIVIIDEAHNLEERILRLLSKTLSVFQLNQAIKEATKINNNRVANILTDFLENIETLAKRKFNINNKYSSEEIIKKEEIIPSKYMKDIFEIIREIEDTGLKFIEKTNEQRSVLITISLFLEEWVPDLKAHIRFMRYTNNRVTINYNALDVSLITKDVLKKTYANIIMSATLTPLTMYKEIFGIDTVVLKEYQSPFDSTKRLDLLIGDVTTKFTNRNEQQYIKIANYINKIVNIVPGNIIIYFPSFEILSEVIKFIKINKPKIIQQENSSAEDFDKMILEFKKGKRTFGNALFAVMGGKASEGIDLPGDYLISAIIVGIPLGKMQLETKSKIEYYDKKYKKGWEYAYIQPAIQKAIQSAGRVIRSIEDRGVIIYLDGRYAWGNYKKCIPSNIKLKASKNILKEISDFFEN